MAIEQAVNDADKRDLIDPESLRVALSDHAGKPGAACSSSRPTAQFGCQVDDGLDRPRDRKIFLQVELGGRQ